MIRPGASAPFKPRLRKLKDGRWCANPTDFTFYTWAAETPEKAYWGLMKLCGWGWTGKRWERWITS